ncbi:MAG TPA: two-component system regulatory protein YycI, partial [Negativicutes bacterium]|nr:two-component system regulatory protein YycI [Negativicutes bacterium]
MDWSKAKLILIVVFILINLYLGYVIIDINTGSMGYVDRESIQRVTDYLAGKDIKVTGQVPDRKIDMSPINVKYKLFSGEDIKNRLFSAGEAVKESQDGHTMRLSGKTAEVSINDSRELLYTDNSIRPAGDVNEKACHTKVKEFLTKLGINASTGMSTVESVEGYKRIVFRQPFKGVNIFNSTMEFYVNDNGIQRARIIWFETVKQTGRKKEVASPVVALLSVADQNKNSILQSREILNIEQGYYFSTGAKDQVDVSKVEEGTAFPVWKITTDKYMIYVNAYDEKVEGVE